MVPYACRANIVTPLDPNVARDLLRLLDRAEKQLGDVLELRLARCRIWAAEGGETARQSLTALAQNLERFAPEDGARLLRELADTWARLGEPARAEPLWRQLVQKQPGDLRHRLALLESCLSSKGQGEEGMARARSELAELRKLEGEEGKLSRFGSALVFGI